jgi:hypothetical protein
MASEQHDCYLIVYNVSKKHNIGTLIRYTHPSKCHLCLLHCPALQLFILFCHRRHRHHRLCLSIRYRCATAFNVKEVCLVGSRQFNTFGSHGSEAHVSYRHFNTLEECCEELKQKYGNTDVEKNFQNFIPFSFHYNSYSNSIFSRFLSPQAVKS